MRRFILAFTTSTLLAASVQAAGDINRKAEKDLDKVYIEWQNPKKFTDVRPSNESRTRFREHTFKRIEAHLEKLAKKLPEGQTLKMVVTDLDLAGRVLPGSFIGVGSANDVRLIKRLDIPRINFNYQLLDKSGNTIKEGTEELKDMGFQDRTLGQLRNDPLRYEKNMLKDWFNDHFQS